MSIVYSSLASFSVVLSKDESVESQCDISGSESTLVNETVVEMMFKDKFTTTE